MRCGNLITFAGFGQILEEISRKPIRNSATWHNLIISWFLATF